jgi:hypothetical protein
MAAIDSSVYYDMGRWIFTEARKEKNAESAPSCVEFFYFHFGKVAGSPFSFGFGPSSANHRADANFSCRSVEGSNFIPL